MKNNYYERWKVADNLVPLSRELSKSEFSNNSEDELFSCLELLNDDAKWNAFLYSVINRGLLFDSKSWTGQSEIFYLNNSYYHLKKKLMDIIGSYELNTCYLDYYKAIELFCDGKDDKSLDLFSSLIEEDCFDLYGWDIGARTCKEYSNSLISVASFDYKLTSIRLMSDHRIPNQNPTILVTCDKRYYQAFNEAIIRSAELNANCTVNIHFHVIDPSFEDNENYIVNNSSNSVGTSVSIEVTDIEDKAYFASARFIRSSEIIKILNDDVLIMDADAYMHQPIQPLFEYLYGYDVGLYDTRGPWGMVPWRKYWAGCMFIRNNKEGHDFANVLKKVHLYLWNYSRSNWWIDQNAIYYSVKFISQNTGSYKIQQMRNFKEVTGMIFPIKTGENYKISTLKAFDSK